MVKRENKTIKMITTNEEEILEKMVAKDHPFRKLNQIINFAEIVSPSWGDEFLTPLVKKYGGRFILKRSDNPSVAATLKLLEEVNKYRLNII